MSDFHSSVPIRVRAWSGVSYQSSRPSSASHVSSEIRSESGSWPVGLTVTVQGSHDGGSTWHPVLTDLWVEARGDGAATQVSCDFELLLEDLAA